MPITAEEPERTGPSYTLANAALKSSCQTGPALRDKPNWLEVQHQDWQRQDATLKASLFSSLS